ncbi:MAG: PAC2 family protein [Nakamurella sp.]
MTHRPDELYVLDEQAAEGLHEPVLLVALDGYVDAGNGVALAVRHLLGGGDPDGRPEPAGDVVATFDVDALLDYRSRRPPLVYVDGAFTSYAQPQLLVRRIRDRAGTDYLVLTGPEPDLHWERFCADVADLVQKLGVRLTVNLLAIPMAVPHTRPAGMSRHSSQPGLVESNEAWMGTISVPGHVSGLLEYRFGELGLPAIGLAAHVPHYLARSDHPVTAQRLLQAVQETTGLALEADELNSAIGQFDAQLAVELSGNDEVTQVVTALEQQYDAFISANGRSLLAPSEAMPTADELAAQVERFLADQE